MKLDKINFIGFIDGNTGYSVLSRALINMILMLNIDVRVEELHGPNKWLSDFKGLYEKNREDRFQILHQIPTVYPNADAFYTVTEFDQPTYGSISPMRKAKFLMTESEFCKKVFEEVCGVETHVIHYPIDPQFKPTGAVIQFAEKVEKFRFKFLSIFEWIMRKDPYTLIKAFVEEFTPDEDVCLILRCWSKFENPRKWIGKLAQGHNVFWMEKNVPHLSPLYRACDCFVTATWGEGFGHPILEAMACGLGVIAPKSTGILDYANSNNATLIKCEETEVGDVKNEIPHLIKPWFKCWKPDFDELKKAMRKAFTNGMKFQRNNAPKVREKFTIEHSMEQMRKVFEIGT